MKIFLTCNVIVIIFSYEFHRLTAEQILDSKTTTEHSTYSITFVNFISKNQIYSHFKRQAIKKSEITPKFIFEGYKLVLEKCPT